jgi:hypothetical protein
MKSQLLTIALFLWLWTAPAAWAHSGPPRIELTVERTAPGSALEVRGVNLVPDAPIAIELIGTDSRYTLGAAQGNEHGDFNQVFTLPADALPGEYVVQASVEHDDVASAPLVLVGNAVAEEGEAIRDEDELLLAPMPAFAPGVVPGQAPAPTQRAPTLSPPALPAAAPSSAAPPWLTLASGLALILIIALAAGALLRQRES